MNVEAVTEAMDLNMPLRTSRMWHKVNFKQKSKDLKSEFSHP